MGGKEGKIGGGNGKREGEDLIGKITYIPYIYL